MRIVMTLRGRIVLATAALLAAGALHCGSAESPATPVANDDAGTGADAAPREDAGAPPADDASAPDAGAVVVAACDGLANVGTFERITPPLGPSPYDDGGGAAQEYGTFAIAADPVHQGTVYAGTFGQGVWKSTNCGATWSMVAKGKNGDVVTSGMNWTLAVDPKEPTTLYTNSGYGAKGSGLLKSTNGGVDWDIVWPPPSQPDLAKAFTYNFANVIAIDPSDHLHVLLTFHEQCLAPHPATCIAETKDGGASWRLIDGNPSWNGNEGQVIFFLENGQSWLWGSQSNGFWRTSNGGGSWQSVSGMTTSHLQGSQLARTPGGAFVVAGADAIWRSPDGAPTTWKAIDGTGPILGGVVADGAAMYAVTCYFPGFCAPRYLASTDEGKTWKAMPNAPNVDMGGTFAFDPGHGVLYSSNGHAGMWRVKVR